MTYPTWIDPTPITRQFIGAFADAPVREPFLKLRKQLHGISTDAQERQKAGGIAKAAKPKKVKKVKGSPRKQRERKWVSGMVLGELEALKLSRSHRCHLRKRGVIIPKFDNHGVLRA